MTWKVELLQALPSLPLPSASFSLPSIQPPSTHHHHLPTHCFPHESLAYDKQKCKSSIPISWEQFLVFFRVIGRGSLLLARTHSWRCLTLAVFPTYFPLFPSKNTPECCHPQNNAFLNGCDLKRLCLMHGELAVSASQTRYVTIGPNLCGSWQTKCSLCI